MAAADENNWLPSMTRAFMALDSSTHAIDTTAFATAMEKVGASPESVRVGRSCMGPCLHSLLP